MNLTETCIQIVKNKQRWRLFIVYLSGSTYGWHWIIAFNSSRIIKWNEKKNTERKAGIKYLKS